jgi:hypothetical protein
MADSVVSAESERRVTPDDPLIINEPQVTFDNVIIEGGEIIVQVPTVTKFVKLTKSS